VLFFSFYTITHSGSTTFCDLYTHNYLKSSSNIATQSTTNIHSSSFINVHHTHQGPSKYDNITRTLVFNCHQRTSHSKGPVRVITGSRRKIKIHLDPEISLLILHHSHQGPDISKSGSRNNLYRGK
jgi:hypothetical protein